MRILITGICGFVGFNLARCWREAGKDVEIVGIDNLCRPGSESHRTELKQMGVRHIHGDLRLASDLAALPPADWVIDAAAQPSVLAGVDGQSDSRQVVEHNLVGTLNLLEYVRSARAGLILLSTSRVYGIEPLASLPLKVHDDAFVLDASRPLPSGVSAAGVDETFSTRPPLSLYGATKRASEVMALEYGQTFGLPVWVNRCGVMAGAGQFGHAQQGIFSYWISSWLLRRPLRYIGFEGHGRQVRDALHPRDLASLLEMQMDKPDHDAPRVINVSGGADHAMSLAQLSRWCRQRFGDMTVAASPQMRRFDVPWLILDSTEAQRHWRWSPRTSLGDILREIADFAQQHPQWLDMTV
ncbi:MAG: NAD-dependent epimerase/dehydratase family protein [Phycisphaeraceae bacterium]|nr:NAD-dependent epimerase/dehydratase family protein [Phycisphaeraceae bacterium]